MSKYFSRFLLLTLFILPVSFFANSQIVYGHTPVEGKILIDDASGKIFRTPAEVEKIESNNRLTTKSPLYEHTAAMIVENSVEGFWLRKLLNTAPGVDIPNPFTYDLPLTKDFFTKVGAVAGANETDTIVGIYNLTTHAVPDYGTPGRTNTDQNKNSTFEEVLSDKKGICRDQAALLNDALKKKGIKSWLVTGNGVGGDGKPFAHVWVRVKMSNGEVFDLDPTWYKDFIKLTPRLIEICSRPTDLKLTKGACPFEKDYTITFVGNNDTSFLSAQTAPKDSIIKLNPNPFTREGYYFVGWSKTRNGKPAYTEGANYGKITANATLYASWDTSYTLVFKPGIEGSTGSMDTLFIKPSTPTKLPDNAFVKKGYVFDYWSRVVNGAKVFGANGTYIVKQGTKNKSDTLYAVWKTIPNIIVNFFAGPGAVSGTMSPQQILSGDTVPLNENKYKKDGYSFLGWATVSGGPVVYTDGDFYPKAGQDSKNLFAVWTENPTHAISFDGNGGEGVNYSMSEKEGVLVNLLPNRFTKPGYSFSGWATSTTGSVTYPNQTSYRIGTADITLYAVWAADPLYGSTLITFDPNWTNDDPRGGPGGYKLTGKGSMSALRVNASTTVNLPPNAFVPNQECAPAGYAPSCWDAFRLNGWCDAKVYTPSRKCYGNQGKFTGTGVPNVTLYAQWYPVGAAAPDNHNYATVSTSWWGSFFRALQFWK